MIKIRFSLKLFIIISMYLFLFGCPSAEAPNDFSLKNPIFPGTLLIETGIPEFDSTVTDRPDFTWVQTGKECVVIAVFDENINVSQEKITNGDDIVWLWHSGLQSGREGNIYFDNGVDVIDGEIQEGPPTSLISGNLYCWAVWAWDDSGREIKYSSCEMAFTVE